MIALMKNSALALVCTICILVPQAAVAACQKQDLQGLWDIYITGVQHFEGSGAFGFIYSCSIRVDAEGQVFTRAACLRFWQDPAVESGINITGQLTIRRGCVITGSINITDFDDVIAGINPSGNVLPTNLVRATLIQDKQMWTGIGRTVIDGRVWDISTISGVRR